MPDRKEFRDLASAEAARAAIDSLELGGGVETVPLADARGRVLAERVDADVDVPGFDRASVDGYAVRAADTAGADEADPARLALAGAVHAGERPDAAVEPGTCVEVSTGAVLPPGADAVVMVERTAELDPEPAGDAAEARTGIAVRTAVAPGDRVMPAGADVAAGARALGPGTELTPREVGLLAALGCAEVPVRERPVVGVVSTGDELVRPGEAIDPAAGQIYDVNTDTVAAAVAEAGGVPRVYPHAGDDVDELERQLLAAADDCDLVCSSGSTSASAVDVVYRVIEERGDLLLHGVAVKPGKPMLVGRLGGAAYVGLPGYPVSALTIFRTFVAPAVRAAAGLAEPRTATVDGRMAVRERYAEGRRRLLPVGLVDPGPDEAPPGPAGREGPGGTAATDGPPGATDGADPLPADAPLVYPVDKGSGATTSLVDADGVVEVDPDTEYLAAGESVTVDLFSPSTRPPALLAVGEADPALARLLDRVERPRFLPLGTRGGRRRLREGVPDVAVVAADTDADTPGRDRVDAADLAGWRREWGLVVPAGNPAGVAGLADLVDRDLRLANRGTESGLRTSLANAVAALAADRGVDRHDVVESIDGFGFATRGVESPARRVLAGDADAGLGLRVTADRLDAGFVPLGWQDVRVLATPARVDKPGVRALVDAVDAGDAIDALPGYERA